VTPSNPAAVNGLRKAYMQKYAPNAAATLHPATAHSLRARIVPPRERQMVYGGVATAGEKIA
jgi:hypothetical protein